MDLLERLNSAVNYIESNMCNEIDINEIAKITLYTTDGFQRLFSYLVGVTLTEYIRHRRLSLAAYELQNSDYKVIDIAVKYGYDSADAFSRAFNKQHGIAPSMARTQGTSLKIYPPISFHIMIKGVKEMDFRIIETECIKLKGLSKQFEGTAAERFEQEHIMWADHHDDVQNKVCTKIPGIWYGIWNNGTYWIAKDSSELTGIGFDEAVIQGGTYAVFKTGYGGFAGDELPKLREQIFDSWLDSSGYKQTSDFEVEVYHLFSKEERHKRYYEIWIPVEKK